MYVYVMFVDSEMDLVARIVAETGISVIYQTFFKMFGGQCNGTMNPVFV